MRNSLLLAPLLLLVTGLGSHPTDSESGEAPYTSEFGLESVDLLLPDGGNRYCSLEPGRLLRYEGIEDGSFVEIEMTVLDQVRPVAFRVRGRQKVALTRVIEEREWIDGELAEVSLNYYARNAETNDIYYFGEDVDLYEDGVVVSHEGSWLAGRDRAQPGLFMPNLYLLGARYCQENAPGVAMDRAEQVGMGLSIETPAGQFDGCIEVLETSELEPDEETLKVYAPGVGPVVDSFLRLVEVRFKQ